MQALPQILQINIYIVNKKRLFTAGNLFLFSAVYFFVFLIIIQSIIFKKGSQTMINNSKNCIITRVTAREILDSRGRPTLEATVFLSGGAKGVASVPSGASTGSYEAHERRDSHMERYKGLGVHGAMHSVSEEISPVIEGKCACEQGAVDHALCDLDGTEDKSRLGANAILAVSLANARAAAAAHGVELFRHLGGVSARRLPVPMLNILNGGAHASNNVEIQEFMIVPKGIGAFTEALRAASEIYMTLGGILKSRGYSTAVGDEGGFAPDLSSDEEAIELIAEAVIKSGYSTDDIGIALDVASSEWSVGGKYVMPKKGEKTDSQRLIKYYEKLVESYPVVSIEDGLSEDDFDGWADLTAALGKKIMLVGDDLFVTNEKRLCSGIERVVANSILIKPNQIGTLTETLNVIRLASESGYKYVISHRSGETEDTFISDLSVAANARYIKTGAPCRGERVAKYNRLMAIEAMLGCSSVYKCRNGEC